MAQAKRHYRFAKAFKDELFASGIGKVLRVPGVAFFADQNFAGARFALKASREIDYVADGCEVLGVVGT